jgi:hypothetical protein
MASDPLPSRCRGDHLNPLYPATRRREFIIGIDWPSRVNPSGSHPSPPPQYVSIKYTQRPVEAGNYPGGKCRRQLRYTVAGTIDDPYGTNVNHRHGPWRLFEVAESATLDGVGWCNHRRVIVPISNTPSIKLNNDIMLCCSNTKSPLDLIQSIARTPGAVQLDHPERASRGVLTRHAPIYIAVATAGS